MSNKAFMRILGAAIFFMAYWFFGNLYEEIVLAPNQLTESYRALSEWQNYFRITNQIYYYVPFTQLAVVALVVLYFFTKDKQEKRWLKRAGGYGLLAIALTILIVTQLNLKLFFGDLQRYKDQLHQLAVIWMLGNGLRLILVGSSLYFAIKAFLNRYRLQETNPF